MDKTDPICGMEGSIPKYDHYFCSENCIRKYEEKEGMATAPKKKANYPLIIFNLALAVLGMYLLQRYGYMVEFMGAVFVILALLKFLDLKGFAKAFAMYDVVAKRSKAYSFIYPFIELALGAGYLLKYELRIVAWATLVVMGVSIIGVTKNLLSKNPIKCACLGTMIKVPLTKFTFFEDLFMGIMAIMILMGL